MRVDCVSCVWLLYGSCCLGSYEPWTIIRSETMRYWILSKKHSYDFWDCQSFKDYQLAMTEYDNKKQAGLMVKIKIVTAQGNHIA